MASAAVHPWHWCIPLPVWAPGAYRCGGTGVVEHRIWTASCHTTAGPSDPLSLQGGGNESNITFHPSSFSLLTLPTLSAYLLHVSHLIDSNPEPSKDHHDTSTYRTSSGPHENAPIRLENRPADQLTTPPPLILRLPQLRLHDYLGSSPR